MAMYCDKDKNKIIKYDELMVTVEMGTPTLYRRETGPGTLWLPRKKRVM